MSLSGGARREMIESFCCERGSDRKAGRRLKGADWMDIRSDRQKGLSYKEIGKKYHLDQRTAKKYAQAESKPVYSLSGPKPSKLDPYRRQIEQWLEEAPYSARKVYEKLREKVTEKSSL